MQKEIDAGYNFKNFSDVLFQPPQGQCSLAQQVQSKRCKDTNSSLSEVASLSLFVEFLVAMTVG